MLASFATEFAAWAVGISVGGVVLWRVLRFASSVKEALEYFPPNNGNSLPERVKRIDERVGALETGMAHCPYRDPPAPSSDKG